MFQSYYELVFFFVEKQPIVGFLQKKVFLKILQNSQKNTCFGIPF